MTETTTGRYRRFLRFSGKHEDSPVDSTDPTDHGPTDRVLPTLIKILLVRCTAFWYKLGNVKECVFTRPACRVFCCRRRVMSHAGPHAGGAKQSVSTHNPFGDTNPNFLVRNQRAFRIFLLFRQSFCDCFGISISCGRGPVFLLQSTGAGTLRLGRMAEYAP